MSANATTSAPSGRKKLAQGKERSDAALGHESQSTSSPERAKEGGELPSGWRWVRLEELANVVRGSSPRPAGDPRYFGGDIPWITVGPITADNTPYLRLVPQTVTAAGRERSRFIEAGTLLLTNSGATLGVPKISLIGGCINDGVAALLDVTESLKLYLVYYLHTQTQRLRGVNQGAAQPNLNTGIIKSIVVPLAPESEQRRIVAEIEKQFTRLEAGVAALRRVQANLKRYRAAVLKAACEGRLVPTQAELQKSEVRGQKSKAHYESGEALLARILTERRQNWLARRSLGEGAQGRGQYKEPAAPDTANLPPLPEGYVWASFGQICRVQGGFAFKSTDYVKEGVPLVRISNLVNGRVQVSEDTVFLPPAFAAANPAFLLRKGDVLIAMSGATTGKMATMDDDILALLNQRVGRFVLSSEELSNAKFVSYLVMQITQKVLKDAYGAAQPNISPAEIEEFAIPLPPMAEQTRIVAEVERRLSVVEELELVVSANLQRAVVRLRQSILQKAFTGQL